MALPTWIMNRTAPALHERARIELRPAAGNGTARPGVTLRKHTDADVPAWEIPGTPVPSLGKVNGYDVVAFAEVPGDPRGPRAGKGSGLFVVIVHRPYHTDRYAVWTVGEFRTSRLAMSSPLPSPRSNGRYVATWTRATELLTERAASVGSALHARV